MCASPRELPKKPKAFPGFTLVEVVIALAIVAFAITALLGAMALGITTDRESVEKLQATHILQSMIAERRAQPLLADSNMLLPTLNSNSSRDSSSPVSLDEIGRPLAGTRTGKFGLVYRITPTAETNSANVYCAIFWPGQSLATNAQGRVEMVTRIPLVP